MAWIHRRRERRLARRAARLLVLLDGLASGRVAPHKVARASLKTS